MAKLVLDQRDLPALRTAAHQIESHFGRIDILFANGGIQQFTPLLEMQDPDWHITIDVNLTGTANAIRAFAPAMVNRRRRPNHRDYLHTGKTRNDVRSRLLSIEMGIIA